MSEKKKLTAGLIIVVVFVFLTALFSAVSLLIGPNITKIIGALGLIIFSLIGIGLIKIKEIARNGLVIILAIGIIAELIMIIIKGLGIIRISATGSVLTRIIISAIIIWYLSKPEIRKLFK